MILYILIIIIIIYLFVCSNQYERFSIGASSDCYGKQNGSNCSYTFKDNIGNNIGYSISGTCFTNECHPSLSLMIKDNQIGDINIEGTDTTEVLQNIKDSIKCQLFNDINNHINRSCLNNATYIHPKDGEENLYQYCTYGNDDLFPLCNEEAISIENTLQCVYNNDQCNLSYIIDNTNCTDDYNFIEKSYQYNDGVGDILCKEGDILHDDNDECPCNTC